MKIDPSLPSPLIRPKAHSQKTERSATASATAAGSSASHQATGAESVPAPFNAERVADIRQAIADGRLQIDADKIAGRLLDDVRQLLAKNRPAK